MPMSQLQRQIQECGYADLGVIDTSLSTHHVALRVASIIGANVSSAIERLGVTQLGVKKPNTYGGNYGLEELPMHTDLAHWHSPPRYVLLRCVKGSAEVSTKVIDRFELERHISPSLMRRALFSPRRPLDGKMYLLRMLTRDAIRWDSLFLLPKNASAFVVTELMISHVYSPSVKEFFLEETGHAILLDNWRVLHGRSPVTNNSLDRLLDRVYLD